MTSRNVLSNVLNIYLQVVQLNLSNISTLVTLGHKRHIPAKES